MERPGGGFSLFFFCIWRTVTRYEAGTPALSFLSHLGSDRKQRESTARFLFLFPPKKQSRENRLAAFSFSLFPYSLNRSRRLCRDGPRSLVVTRLSLLPFSLSRQSSWRIREAFPSFSAYFEEGQRGRLSPRIPFSFSFYFPRSLAEKRPPFLGQAVAHRARFFIELSGAPGRQCCSAATIPLSLFSARRRTCVAVTRADVCFFPFSSTLRHHRQKRYDLDRPVFPPSPFFFHRFRARGVARDDLFYTI